MRSKVRRLGIAVTVVVAIALAVVLLAPSSLPSGVTSEVGSGGFPLSTYDLSAMPQSVVEDATGLATELCGDCQEMGNDFISQLLATYSAAKDSDFIVFFNSGGWGWNLLENSPGWQSIVTGIQSELKSLDYELLLLDYMRTENSQRGRLNELMEGRTGYPSKAKDLAFRVEFLTSHLPDLRVILTGESNGTVIADRVMTILEDNPQVYSSQTGPTFWHKNVTLDRTLVLTGNGIVPDSFSQGDVWAIVWGNLRYWFRLSQPENDFGTTFHYVRTPGHDYWWQYPEVRSRITSFLEQNFGVKQLSP